MKKWEKIFEIIIDIVAYKELLKYGGFLFFLLMIVSIWFWIKTPDVNLKIYYMLMSQFRFLFSIICFGFYGIINVLLKNK